MSQGIGSNGRMAMIAILAVAILAISLRALMSMETSLEEGRGPQGGNPFATLSLMVLIVALILRMSTQIRSGASQFTTDNMRIAALMAAMFSVVICGTGNATAQSGGRIATRNRSAGRSVPLTA